MAWPKFMILQLGYYNHPQWGIFKRMGSFVYVQKLDGTWEWVTEWNQVKDMATELTEDELFIELM